VTDPRKARVFISFDYDHDRDLKTMLVGQSRNEDSLFFIEDHSIKVDTVGWKEDARKRIQRSDLVLVVCGLHTHGAVGVTAEIEMARDENIRYSLLKGRKEGTIRRPKGTSWFFDDLHPWTWKELERLTSPRQRPSWKKLW
jgi:MTH538 TIR-like domain (DUF1863)